MKPGLPKELVELLKEHDRHIYSKSENRGITTDAILALIQEKLPKEEDLRTYPGIMANGKVDLTATIQQRIDAHEALAHNTALADVRKALGLEEL